MTRQQLLIPSQYRRNTILYINIYYDFSMFFNMKIFQVYNDFKLYRFSCVVTVVNLWPIVVGVERPIVVGVERPIVVGVKRHIVVGVKNMSVSEEINELLIALQLYSLSYPLVEFGSFELQLESMNAVNQVLSLWWWMNIVNDESCFL